LKLFLSLSDGPVLIDEQYRKGKEPVPDRLRKLFQSALPHNPEMKFI
jgi:hypothetical protein